MFAPWLQSSFEQIKAQAASGRLAQSMLLTGEPGIGKTELAAMLAQLMLCSQNDHLSGAACGQCSQCKLFLSVDGHPDHMVVKTLPDSKNIGVDAVREVISVSQQTPHVAKVQVFVVENADRLTAAAANALLKVIEEPTASTYFILTTSQVKSLLPTIISRCQKWTLPAPKISQALDWVSTHGGFKNEDSRFRLCCAKGPYAALSLSEEHVDLLQQFFQQLVAFSNHAYPPVSGNITYDKWVINDALNLASLCNNALLQMHRQVQAPGDDSLGLKKLLNSVNRRVNVEALFKFHEFLIQLNKQWQQSGSAAPALVIEQVLLKWQKCFYF